MWGFVCEHCDRTFADGIDAGQHEIETGHRTTHADLCRLCGAEATRDGYCELDYRKLSRGED